MSGLMRFFSMAQGARVAVAPRILPLSNASRLLNITPVTQAIRQAQPSIPSPMGGIPGLLFCLLVGSGLVGLGKVLAEQWQKPNPTNPIKNLDDLKKTQNHMLHTLSSPSKDLKGIVDVINEVVTLQDGKSFARYLEKLFKDYTVSDDYLDLLISTCTVQGKVSLLRILQEEFNLDDLIEKNPTALALLNHPFANEIEQLSGEFIKGVGNIKIDGAQLQLRYKQAKDEESAIERADIDSPLVTGLDNIGDVRLMLSFLREQDEARAPVRDLYKKVVVLDVLGEGSESFVHYLETLKALYEQQQKPITSIFLLHGGHVTCGEITLNKTVDGEYGVQMFYMDSLGRGANNQHPGYWLIRDCEYVFPKQVEYYLSEVKNQHASLGCSVFTLMHVYDLIHLNQTLATHAEAGLPRYKDLFDYIKHHITDIKESEYHEHNTDIPVKFNYLTVLPPLAFSRGKQTLTRTGIDTQNLGDPRPVVGYMGIPLEVESSSPERQKELGLVVNHTIPMTMKEWGDYYVRPTNNVSKNQTTTLLIGQWGLELAPWLTQQKTSDIKEFTQAFTLHEFAKKNNITTEDVPLDTNGPAGP